MNAGIPKNELSLTAWYTQAWKAFRKWWIPLCLISGALFIFQGIPQLMLHAEQSAMIQNYLKLFEAVLHSDFATFDQISLEINRQNIEFTKKLIKLFLYCAPVFVTLSIILMVFANAAIKDKRTKISFGRVLYCSWSNLLLTVIRMSAFLFFFFPGFYIYVKLFFVSLIMIEEEKSFGEAMKISWRMTTGHIPELLLLLLTNIALQLIASSTVIGVIPATGFANTARAAAYHAIKTHTSGVPAGK